MNDFKNLTREDLRVKLKEFERDFEEKHKRKPEKADIKSLTSVCAMYKWYHTVSMKPTTRSSQPSVMSQPSVTHPPVTHPPVTQPPVTQPPVTQPPVKSQPSVKTQLSFPLSVKPDTSSTRSLARMKRPAQGSPQKASGRSLKKWKSSAPASQGADFDSPSKFVNASIGGIKQKTRAPQVVQYITSPEKSPVKPLLRRSSSFTLPTMDEEEIDRMLGLGTSSPIDFSSDDSGLESPQSSSPASSTQVIWSDLSPSVDQNLKPFRRGYVNNNSGGNFKRIDLKHKHFAKGKPGAKGANLRRQVLMKKGKEANVSAPKDSPIQAVSSPVIAPCKINAFDFQDLKFDVDEIKQGLKRFGFDKFNLGQDDTVNRVLQGKSTVFVARTGSGKSLCYQLPAYLLSKSTTPSCVLVISPLIALIEDQISQLPDFLKGVSLHSGQSEKEAYEIRMTMKDCQPDIVFLSPERIQFYLDQLVCGRSSLFHLLPPISFVCVDEVHCLSQWSHNFRPTYLRICQLLRHHLHVNCFLGLTATLSRREVGGVMQALEVEDDLKGEALINCFDMPTNQTIIVLEDVNRDEALIDLIQTKLVNHLPLIVYCNRREEAERVAMRIRIGCTTKDTVLAKKLRSVVAYHAGLAGRKLASLRKQFAEGKLSVLVATEAFSLGINKMDLGAVILYNMPGNWESVVQKFGRAGRDGNPCFGFIFLDSGRRDERELIKLMYNDYCPDGVIKQLVSRIFVNDLKKCGDNFDYFERMIALDDVTRELDLREEVITTLFTYMELLDPGCIQYLGRYPRDCTIRMTSAKALTNLINNRPFLQQLSTSRDAKSSSMQIQSDSAVACLGTDYFTLTKNIESLRVFSNGPNRCNIDWNTSEQYLLVRCKAKIAPEELDNMTDKLITTVKLRLRASLNAMTTMRQHISEQSSVSIARMNETDQEVLNERSGNVKQCIMTYFDKDQTDLSAEANEETKIVVSSNLEDEIRTDVRAFRSVYSCDNPDLTAINVARIFYGIQTPNYPAQTWGRVRQFWRKYVESVDFRALLRIIIDDFTN